MTQSIGLYGTDELLPLPFHVQPEFKAMPWIVVLDAPPDDLAWLDRYAEDTQAEAGYQEDT